MTILKMTTKANTTSHNLTTLFLLIFLSFSAYASVENPTPLVNQLGNHPSPYLALHGNDPVIWQDWSEEVVQRAKAENKLIFVSSGYFSCHWCHVMQRESFSDKNVAEQLDKLAIAVKVDRELQPALDAWLIDFTERTAGQAGWPLNVFLTPDGYPLVGLTYMPKENFLSVITQLQTKWSEEESGLRSIALSAFNSMKPEQQSYSSSRPKAGMDKVLVTIQGQQALSQADEISGGFGDQNKFPMSPILLSLLESQKRYPNEALGGFLKLTLDQMANLGLRDHIGGGFYRYTVDPAWDIPHFEKMLYDNAMLSKVYLLAADILQQPHYRDIAYDTLDFLIREMRADNGGFYASLSAVDDKDVEGGYYLWQVSELKQLLTVKEFLVASEVWGARGAPYLEAGHHLKQVASPESVAKKNSMETSEANKLLLSAKKKLFTVRQQRNLPVDNKVLAAWNGLLLESLSLAARSNDKYKPHAQQLYRLLGQKLWNGKVLSRFIHKNNAGGRVSLEDYAYVTAGMVEWAKVSNNTKVWSIANDITNAAMQRFHNQHGWQLSEKLVIPYDARELILPDNTMPSPSAALLRTRLRIAQHLQQRDVVDKIARLTDIENGALLTAPLWYGSQVNLISETLNSIK